MSLHNAQVGSLKTKCADNIGKRKVRAYYVHGRRAGLYKNACKVSYLRVFGAGHKVPAYKFRRVPRGAAALQMFEQIMSDRPLFST